MLLLLPASAVGRYPPQTLRRVQFQRCLRRRRHRRPRAQTSLVTRQPHSRTQLLQLVQGVDARSLLEQGALYMRGIMFPVAMAVPASLPQHALRVNNAPGTHTHAARGRRVMISRARRRTQVAITQPAAARMQGCNYSSSSRCATGGA